MLLLGPTLAFASVLLFLLHSGVPKQSFLLVTPPLATPPVSSEEALCRRAPFLVPPRRVEPTSHDSNGCTTTGMCLPYALLLQVQRVLPDAVPKSRSLKSINSFRDAVLDYVLTHHKAAWTQDRVMFHRHLAHLHPHATLGTVVVTYARTRWEWLPATTEVGVPFWAVGSRVLSRDGCGADFLFAAAACFGLRIHVHYQRGSGFAASRTVFETPSSAAQELLRPRADVHLGYVEGDGTNNHYVSLPLLWERV